MRSTYTIDDVPLDDFPRRWVNEDQTLHGPQSLSMVQLELPNMPGEVPLPGTLNAGAADFTLSMTVTGETYEHMIANLDRLYAIAAPAGRMVNITEHMPSGEWRTTTAYLTGANIGKPWTSDDDGAEVDLTFRLPTGVWLGPEVTTQITGAGMASVATGALGGSAPMYETRLTVTGSDVYFQLSSGGNPNANIAYIGDTGGEATIWPKAVFATNGSGTNVSTNLSTGTRTFHVPADGIFRVDHFSGVTSATITTRKAYY